MISRSYAIAVEYDRGKVAGGSKSLTLHLTADSTDLGKFLHMLNECDSVANITVSSTITIPHLHKFSKLTRTDLGVDEHSLGKLK